MATPLPVISFDRLPADCICIVQLTDTHFYAEPDGSLLGMHTVQSLRHCMDLIQAQHADMDLVLATGDLTHDGSMEGYLRLREMLLELQTPVHAIPGNHDDPEILQEILGGGLITTGGRYLDDRWQIILLDSCLENSDTGKLADTQLQHMEQALQQYPEHHALVCLHHSPVKIGSPWLDTMQLQNSDEFFTIVDRHPQVRGVLWGHIHQDFHQQRNHVELLASPSTCVQFKPGAETFTLDTCAPGYRWLVLRPDGIIETGICRLPFMPDEMEIEADGY